MSNLKQSSVIYGDSPFIEDMGVLTTLCLLHDEVLLFGSKPLDEHLNDYWERSNASGDGTTATAVEQAFQVLLPEKAISFLSPSDVEARFPGSNATELSGIDGFETTEVNGKTSLVPKIDVKNLSHVSRLILAGFTNGPRTVSSVIRDASLISPQSNRSYQSFVRRSTLHLRQQRHAYRRSPIFWHTERSKS